MPHNIQALKVAELYRHEHEAIKAVSQGQATEYQQRLCLEVIIKKFARTHDLPWVPGSFDQSSVLSGRAYVGMQILKFSKLPMTFSPEAPRNEEVAGGEA